MKSPAALKPTRTRRVAQPSGSRNHYSTNPIIERFLELTLEEGHSVRGVALRFSSGSSKTVIFSLADGTDQTLTSDQENGTFMSWWKDTAELVRRFRQIDLSPAL